jgi:hypothetical protein
VRSSLEGCNGIVGVKAVGKRSNNGSRTMGFNTVHLCPKLTIWGHFVARIAN